MVTSDRDGFVFVALPGQSDYVVAGRHRVTVEPGGTPLGEFVYGRSYLSRSDAVALDPVELRLTERVRKTRRFNGLFGAIRDALPATWGSLAARDALGALEFSRGLEPPRPQNRYWAIDDLDRLQASADSVLASRDERLGTERSRARRVRIKHRPKVTIQDDHTLWVAKFTQEDTVWDQARVRHATLQLARDCGLDAAPSRIERVNGRGLLMVRRYDREWVGDRYLCSRAITGLTLLGTDGTPADRERWSYLALADAVRFASSHPREDLRELFGRMCFNAAVSNLRDDLAYPTMFARGHGWRLGPLIRLAPTPVVDGTRGDATMIYGPLGRSPTRENIVAAAGRFLLDRAAAEAIFDRIRAKVRSSWRAVMRRCGVSARDRELVARSIMNCDAHD